MSSKTAIEKQQHGYRRYQALARSLRARIFATAEGRLLLVGGKPSFERLLACLSRRRETPQPMHAPTPSDLGFPAFCDGELTLHGLQIRSHALTRWSRALDGELRRRPPNKRRAKQIVSERREITCLRRRLSEIHRWHREIVSGHPPQGLPYLLQGYEEQYLTETLAEIEGQNRLPPLVPWLARIVMWSSGLVDFRRFLDSLTPLLRSEDAQERISKVRKFQQQLRIWKHRCGEQRHALIHNELRQGIRNLPPLVLLEGKFGSRLRGRTLPEHCDLLAKRCQEMLKLFREIPAFRIPACMAALAACDGGHAAFPTRVVKKCLEDGDLATIEYWVSSLHYHSDKPAYNELLLALQQLPELPERCQNDDIRKMLARGFTLDEIAWTQQKDLTCWFDCLALHPAWLRSFLERVSQKGIVLNDSQVSTVLEMIEEKRDITVLDHWLKWLGMFSEATFTPRARQTVIKGLLDLIVPGVKTLACHQHLQRWANPPTRRRFPIDSLAAAHPTLPKWLRRIHFYQELAGEKTGVPKSIRKQLDTLNRQAGERAYLRRAAAEGHATATQAARLEYLDKTGTGLSKTSQESLNRTAEEAFLIAAMDALRITLRGEAKDILREYGGDSLTTGSLDRLISFAGWVRAMEDPQRQLLRELLQTWSEHGPAYQEHLTANQPWLEKARSHGLNLEHWLLPGEETTVVDGKPVRISVAHQPVEVFLMGTYFNTCLSQGGCNQMSVLANAHDANKQVVYMHTSQGKVRARQLVVVNDEFGLLGYSCYTGVSHDDDELRDKYIAAMADYCGRWARRCGISLADEGEPAKIADHFWYDDGTHQWHEAARSAWADKQRPSSTPLNQVLADQGSAEPVLV